MFPFVVWFSYDKNIFFWWSYKVVVREEVISSAHL
ncbi:uncharacterized protein METZ01_LOCUS487913, partial [marine metagenome]